MIRLKMITLFIMAIAELVSGQTVPQDSSQAVIDSLEYGKPLTIEVLHDLVVYTDTTKTKTRRVSPDSLFFDINMRDSGNMQWSFIYQQTAQGLVSEYTKRSDNLPRDESFQVRVRAVFKSLISDWLESDWYAFKASASDTTTVVIESPTDVIQVIVKQR